MVVKTAARWMRAALAVLLIAATQPAHGESPMAPVEPVTDDYYGTKVVDPYRWMESGEDPRWMPWLRAQASEARRQFDALPERARFLADAQALSGEVVLVQKVLAVGGVQFTQRRDPGREDPLLYVRRGEGVERVLLDAAKIAGGDQVLDWWYPSPDGKLVAVGLSKRGTEASVAHVLEVATGRLLGDRIPNADFGVYWLPDNSGFTYIAMVGERGKPSYFVNNEARLHLIGAKGNDLLLISRLSPPVPLKPDQFNFVATSDGSDAALLGVRDGRSESALYSGDLSAVLRGEARWTRISDFDDLIVDQSWSGDRLWLLSRKDNSNGSLLLTSARSPSLTSARRFALPGKPVIEQILATRSGVLVKTLEAGASALWRVDGSGRAQPIALPFAGTIRWIENDPKSDAAFFSFTGWFAPAKVFELTASNAVRDLEMVTPPPALDVSKYESRSSTAVARDGTRIPYTVVARKGLPHDGRNPLLIEAYGSYGFSATPSYRSALIPFLDRGGVYVLANVRGGGEFGRAWHYAGKAETKANTWRDAIDVAETLVKIKLTSPEHMTILGTSAGGVMVGQAVNERPDLFSGAIANVGFMNPIRYVSEQNFADIQEWGGPIKDAGSFRTMFNLDPYNHIKDGARYPATLVVSGINDPRAATFHGAKYAARIAAATAGDEPVLLRIDFDAGHGLASSSRTQADQLWTDIYSFALWQGGVKTFQPR